MNERKKREERREKREERKREKTNKRTYAFSVPEYFITPAPE